MGEDFFGLFYGAFQSSQKPLGAFHTKFVTCNYVQKGDASADDLRGSDPLRLAFSRQPYR